MPATKHDHKTKLPGKFEELVRQMPPQAIMDEVHYDNTVEMINRLMASGKLTKGQESYLETLVQLVQAYEAARHAIEAPKGIDTLRHLLEEHNMSASALARVLGIHASMGSKILKGERALTVDHLKLLAAKFKVRADTFMD
ncbi:MAG: type II toxin-antitoxin system HigA family antitoxin [Phycisphaerales bacterium]